MADQHPSERCYGGRGRRGLFGFAIAVLAGVLSTVLAIPQAAAHDSVIDADPGVGAAVAEFPRTVTLIFSGEPRPNFNRVAISDAQSKEVLFSGEPKLDGRVVSIDVPAGLDPGAGDYVVGFQITSSDGHSTRGKTTFSVVDPHAAVSDASASSPAGDASAADSAPEASAAGDQGPATWLWGALGAVAVAAVAGGLGVVGWSARRRKIHSTDNPSSKEN